MKPCIASGVAKPKSKKQERDRYQLDIDPKTRERFEGAARKLHMTLAAFLRLAAEEKIRRDVLG